MLSIAEGYERRGNFAKARRLYGAVLARHPGQSAALRGLEVVAAREKARQALHRQMLAKQQGQSNPNTRTAIARVHDTDDFKVQVTREQPAEQPIVAPRPTVPRPSTSAVITADNVSNHQPTRSTDTAPATSGGSLSPSVAAPEPRWAHPFAPAAANSKSTDRPPSVTSPPPVVVAVQADSTASEAATAPTSLLSETENHFLLPEHQTSPLPAFQNDPFADRPVGGQRIEHLQQKSNVPYTTVIEAYADNPARAVPQLTELLDDDSASNRSLAAYLLGQSGLAAKSAVPILQQRLKDEPLNLIRIYIAEALLRINPDDRDGIRVLLRSLDDRSESSRLIAACALSSATGNRHEAEAVKALTASLYDTAPTVRAMAALSLGQMGTAARAAVPNLTAIQFDEQLNVREAATSALACITQISTGELTDDRVIDSSAASMSQQPTPLLQEPGE